MADKFLTPTQQDIIDPHPTGGKAAEVVETILPYFPEHPSMRRYLAYISCGYTRLEAIRRCRAMAERDSLPQDDIDLEHWRNTDPEFRKLDDAGYNSLKEKAAIIYMELMLRRDTVAVLELNEKVIRDVNEKMENGYELTKDEKFIYNKAVGMYTPDKLAILDKLIHGTIDPDDKPKGQLIDFVAIVKGQIRQ